MQQIKKEKMSLRNLAGAFALIGALGTSQASAQSNEHEFNHQTPSRAIPVDCDLLNSGGQLTRKFRLQYANPNHIRGNTYEEALEHMRNAHGLTEAVFKRGRDICNEHFPR